jgi:hypothetical protein
MDYHSLPMLPAIQTSPDAHLEECEAATVRDCDVRDRG